MAEENRVGCTPGGCPYNVLLNEFISTQKADIETFCQEALDAGFDPDALGMDGDSEAAGLQVKEGEGLSLEVSCSGEFGLTGMQEMLVDWAHLMKDVSPHRATLHRGNNIINALKEKVQGLERLSKATMERLVEMRRKKEALEHILDELKSTSGPDVGPGSRAKPGVNCWLV